MFQFCRSVKPTRFEASNNLSRLAVAHFLQLFSPTHTVTAGQTRRRGRGARMYAQLIE